MNRNPAFRIFSLFCLFLANWAVAEEFQSADTLGTVKNPELIELSGIVEGVVNPEVLWVHNDRHNLPRLYALNRKGETVATLLLNAFNDEDTMSGDWEDIARLSGGKEGGYNLYIADFGNNPMKKRVHRLLVIEEPDLEGKRQPEAEEIDFSVIQFAYPGDYVCNSECLLVHPGTGEFLVVSKAVKEGKEERPSSAVWSLSDLRGDQLVHTATMLLDEIPAVEGRVTGGDISSDGRQVILRTNTPTAYLWEIQDGQTLKEAFLSEPIQVEMSSEKGGEAICFSSDGSKLYTVYDGKKPNRPLNVFERQSP